MWRTSIPKNWNSISSRPAYRIKGRLGKRDTMEFLKETQRYIDLIRKPMVGDEEILGISKAATSPRLRSVSPPASGDRQRPPSFQQERQELGSAVVLVNPPFSPLASSPVSPCSSPPSESVLKPLTGQMKRTASMPMCLTEPGSAFPSPETPQKDYIVTAYVRPHMLIAKTRKEKKDRPRRTKSPEMEEFLNRFDRKPTANVAPPVCRGLPGWKLTISSRVQSARMSPKIQHNKELRPPRTSGFSRACTPWQLKLALGREEIV